MADSDPGFCTGQTWRRHRDAQLFEVVMLGGTLRDPFREVQLRNVSSGRHHWLPPGSVRSNYDLVEEVSGG